MNNQSELEQTVVRQAVELTQANTRIKDLEQADRRLQQLVCDHQNEISKLRPEVVLLERMREAFRDSFRDIPIPFPLRGRTGVPNVTYGDFQISASGIACEVQYELNGSTYGIDFVLVPMPQNGRNLADLYPGYNFDIWGQQNTEGSK